MGTTRDAIHAVLDELAGRLPELDASRDVPEGIGLALAEAGIIRLHAARSLGGLDATLAEAMELLEDIARVDASVAWRSLVACEAAPALARLPVGTLDALYCAGPDFVSGTMFAPKGTAVEVEGGYRVSGRWPNATGCDRCVWLSGVCMVIDADGGIRRTPEGLPELRAMVFPAANAHRADTWHTFGLHAAGGHDVVVDDVYVPAERSFDPFGAPPASSHASSFSLLCMFSLHAGAVALGVADGALADLDEGVRSAPPAKAAASTLRAARTMLFDLAHGLDQRAVDGEQIDLHDRVSARSTASWAVSAAGSIVSTAYELGADLSPGHRADLARRFRDIHALSQMVSLIQDHLSPGSAVLVGAALTSV